MVNLHNERNRLPAHERSAVTDEELRIGSRISDEEWLDSMAKVLPAGVLPTRTEPESNGR